MLKKGNKGKKAAPKKKGNVKPAVMPKMSIESIISENNQMGGTHATTVNTANQMKNVKKRTLNM